MKNADYIKAYVKGTAKARNNRMVVNGNKLYHYTTEICELDRSRRKARLNIKYYSSGTSTIRNQLRRELQQEGYEIEEYEGP